MKTKYSFLLGLSLMVCSCTEKQLEPISGSLGKPGVVTELSAESIAGGAIISYRIPNSEDILGVKGVYTLSNGKQYEASSSFYENKLKIVGFNDTLKHVIKVYAINRAQELSDPVEITVNPLESSLSKAIKTVYIVSDFGGAQYNWRNGDKAPLTFEFLAQDSLGVMRTMKIITSEIDTSRYSLRGYDPSPRSFATILRDNFGNASDTIYPTEGKITPLFEEKLNKKKMVVMRLGNDANFTNWDGADNNMIDDNLDNFGHSPANALPAAFTVDLGCVAKPSRIVMHQRLDQNYNYGHGNPKNFIVYGCDTKPNQNGDWSEWKEIMKCEIIKPSGSPSGTVTDEDKEAAKEGHEFAFELTQTPLRYIRIKILDTWGGATFTHPAEVDFFGEVVEENK